MLIVLVRGSGDIGSATAHLLFQTGYGVFIHDSPLPTVTRRKMSFTDAIFDGQAMLDGVTARAVDDIQLLRGLLHEHQVIPVTDENIFTVLNSIHPHILIDARMRKHQQPENQTNLASLTIGLGPNFIAGETTHLAIETARGEFLGKVIAKGSTAPLHGAPQTIDGHARDRYIYSPVSGIFQTEYQIGDPVQDGEEIARVNDLSLYAPIRGVLRGLTRNGVPVGVRTKVVEVDPRFEGAQISGIAERPACIAQGVLQAILSWEANQIG